MKIYIIADMEGISGIRRPQQVDPGDPDYISTGRKFLTGDVNAAVAGAFEGGATEVLVCDWHGGGYHILLDELDPRAQVERTVHNRNMLAGLDESFAGLFCVGFHAMAGTIRAFQDHTMVGAQWYNYYVNGRKTGECGMAAIWAGHWGASVLMVTGDTAACAEAREFLGPDAVTVPVKEGLTRSIARVIQPARAQEMIREGARKAMSLVGKIPPYKIDLPATIRLELTRSDYADAHDGKPGITRLDARTVEMVVDSALDIYGF